MMTPLTKTIKKNKRKMMVKILNLSKMTQFKL